MSLLDRPYKSWRKAELHTILGDYGHFPKTRATKLELMTLAQEAVEEYGPSGKRGRTQATKLVPMSSAQKAIEYSLAGGQRRGRSLGDSRVKRPNYRLRRNWTRRSRSHRKFARSIARNEGEESSLGHNETSLQTDGMIPDQDEVDQPECSVCLDTLDDSNMALRAVTSLCRHKRNVCMRCIATSITTQFSEKAWDQVECPSCKERLTYHDMETFADREIFEK